MNFHVGQKVVCIHQGLWINDGFFLTQLVNWLHGFRHPVYAEICLIACIQSWHPAFNSAGLRLMGKSPRTFYRAALFRPLVDTKTDISIFTVMLDPARRKQRAPAS